MIVLLSFHCLKSLSPWFWMARNFTLEMVRGIKNQEYISKRGGVCKKCTCVYEGEGGQILEILLTI